jgi:hypothetical protein
MAKKRKQTGPEVIFDLISLVVPAEGSTHSQFNRCRSDGIFAEVRYEPA